LIETYPHPQLRLYERYLRAVDQRAGRDAIDGEPFTLG
jgi:hypothetical protein